MLETSYGSTFEMVENVAFAMHSAVPYLASPESTGPGAESQSRNHHTFYILKNRLGALGVRINCGSCPWPPSDYVLTASVQHRFIWACRLGARLS